MATQTVQKPTQVPGIMEFARAFRAASRAVGFYPPSHPATLTALESVLVAAKPLTEHGSLCLTILPDTFLAGGVPIDGSERLVGEMSMTLHRHGIGALNLNGRATVDSWRALFTLLSLPPEDVRANGGFQRQWKAFRHHGPGVLEIDFGELLRGRVGGDYSELAAVIGHYLDTAGVGLSLANDVLATLTRALESAPDDEAAVNALVGQLRTAAHLVRVLQPERFDEVFERAATLAAHVNERVMAGLLARRGTAEAMLGALDVVGAFLDRIPNDAAARFLAGAIVEARGATVELTETLTRLLPDAGRRREVTQAAQQSVAQDVTFEGGILERWAEIEQQLESYSDRQFVPDPYARELHSARSRAATAFRTFDDPDERISAWVSSIDDTAVRSLDLSLLGDLSRVETDPLRWRDVLAILRGHVFDAAETGDWDGSAAAAEAIARVATDQADAARAPQAGDVLHECGRNWVAEEALARMEEGRPDQVDGCMRLLNALGPGIIPSLVRRWAVAADPEARQRLEAVVIRLGHQGRHALAEMLPSGDLDQRCAAVRLLLRAGGHEHLPVLETMLTDPSTRLQQEALAALAGASIEQGRELAARGIARAGDERMGPLLDMLGRLGSERAVPVLRHLVRQVDLKRTPMPLLRQMIDGLQRGRSALAADGLARLFEPALWRAPFRLFRVRSAAMKALRVMGTPGRDALGSVSRLGGRR